MKKVSVIGSLVLCVGLILVAVAFILSGGDYTRLSTSPKYEKKEYSLASTNQAVFVTDENITLRVEPSQDNEIHLLYYENERETYRITEGDEVLRIEKQRTKEWRNFFFNFDLPQGQLSLTLQLPKDYRGDLSLDTRNATITAENLSLLDAAFVTSNGAIQLTNLTAKELSCESGNGAFSFEGIKAESFTAITSNGKMQGEEITVAKDLEFRSTNAPLALAEASIGGEAILGTTNGKITVSAVEVGQKLRATTQNGNIRGSLVGRESDFTIKTNTRNGKNSLPTESTGGAKELIVETANGDIEITFTES